MKFESQMKQCGFCKAYQTMKAKPRIQYNLSFVNAKKGRWQNYNNYFHGRSPDSISNAFQIHLFFPDVCQYSPSPCVKEVNNSLPCQFYKERQVCLSELFPRHSSACTKVVCLHRCSECACPAQDLLRARRHRPPDRSTSEKARWLLLMQFTFSLRGPSLSDAFVMFQFLGGGVETGWNLGRTCMAETVRRNSKRSKGQEKIIKKQKKPKKPHLWKRPCTAMQNLLTSHSLVVSFMHARLLTKFVLVLFSQYLDLICMPDLLPDSEMPAAPSASFQVPGS